MMADDRAKNDVACLIDQVIRDRITVLPAVPALLSRGGSSRDSRNASVGRCGPAQTMPASLPALSCHGCRA